MEASSQYVETSITTQQRGKLIVMLYDGAVKFLRVAKEKLQDGDCALKGVYIGKAQDIIAELNGCLDISAAPKIARDLRALYNFLYRHLSEANIERSEKKIDECIGILEELRDAWREVAERTASTPPIRPSRPPKASWPDQARFSLPRAVRLGSTVELSRAARSFSSAASCSCPSRSQSAASPTSAGTWPGRWSRNRR